MPFMGKAKHHFHPSDRFQAYSREQKALGSSYSVRKIQYKLKSFSLVSYNNVILLYYYFMLVVINAILIIIIMKPRP